MVYGEPLSDGVFYEYQIETCGPVLVDEFEGSIVTTILVFAPREGDDQHYFEPDDADLTITEAMAIVESFLPADAVFNAPVGDINPPAPGMLGDLIVVTRWSDLLMQNVPAAAYEYVDNSPT